MNNLIFFGALIIIAFQIALILYLLGGINVFFTKVKTSTMKFVQVGDSFKKVIHDIPGKRYDYVNDIFVTGTEDYDPTLKNTFGLWWVGIWPLQKVRSFKIKKERENPAGTSPVDWITDKKEEEVSELLLIIPRPFIFMGVELGGRSTVDLLLSCKFEVIHPKKMIIDLNANFFTLAESMLSAEVNILTAEVADTQEKYTRIDKSEQDGYLKSLKNIGPGTFNEKLEELVGLRLIGVNIPKWEPEDREMKKAAAKEELAILDGKALIATANARSTAKGIDAKADSDYEEKITTAEIGSAVKAFKDTGAEANKVAEGVMEFLKSKNIGKSATITTYVEKGNGTIRPV